MGLPRRCTECGGPLNERQKYTCRATCRSRRSRRLKRQKRDAGNNSYPAQYQELNAAMSEAAGDVAHEVLKEELRPIAREAITEDTVRAMADMVAMLPRAVAAIGADIGHDDPVVRQRAYTLLTKYTIGHPAVVQPEDQAAGQMVVNFNLPRPGDDVETAEATGEFVSELRTCDMCDTEKPVTEFVAGSQRCSECYDRIRAQAGELLKGGAD